jgi:hypothetical protein
MLWHDSPELAQSKSVGAQVPSSQKPTAAPSTVVIRHALPHCPQFDASMVVSMYSLPHSVRGCGQSPTVAVAKSSPDDESSGDPEVPDVPATEQTLSPSDGMHTSAAFEQSESLWHGSPAEATVSPPSSPTDRSAQPCSIDQATTDRSP